MVSRERRRRHQSCQVLTKLKYGAARAPLTMTGATRRPRPHTGLLPGRHAIVHARVEEENGGKVHPLHSDAQSGYVLFHSWVFPHSISSEFILLVRDINNFIIYLDTLK